MNTFLALIAVIVGVLLSLVAYRIVSLDKYIGPGQMEDWHDKYGKICRILGPIAVVVGIVLLFF